MISSLFKANFFLSLITIFLFSPLLASDEQLETNASLLHKGHVLSQEDFLIQAGTKFVNYLTLIGKNMTPITEEGLLDLFTPSCAKIVNGQTLCRSVAEHHEQLLDVRESLGQWAVERLRVCPSPSTSACAVHFQ